MGRIQSKAVMAFLAVLLSALSLSVSCASDPGFDDRLSSITKPHEFNTLKWESGALLGQAKDAVLNRNQGAGGEMDRVIGYFALGRRMISLNSQIEATNAGKEGAPASLGAELDSLQQQASASKSAVAKTIKKQIGETLSQQGIFNPVDRYLGLKTIFPPINFEMGGLPYLLVISPRDHIEQIRGITLRPGLTMEETESLEAGVDKLGVSSLVVELGGFAGTYPVFVTDRASLRFTIDTIAHEWLHQYLAFQPLGFAYLLHLAGISRNYEIATINETVASMFGKEIADTVYANYYAQYLGTQPKARAADSEFNREMREIRRTVDQYLAQGEIEPAEKFMEQRRQYLVSKGYYIRKLNQAYFAFHGTYADSPTSISPIGSDLRKLRSQQNSLKDFLAAVSVMTSHQDLIDSLK